MTAARILLTAVLLFLAACTAPQPAAPQPAAPQPAAPSVAAQQPPLPAAAADAIPQPALTAAALPASGARLVQRTPPPAVASAQPVQPTRVIVTDRTPASPTLPVPFNIGVPAGDAYYPYSVAIDPARNVAYVYHADSVEKRPVISVVDLAAGKVTRLIRLAGEHPGAAGRLFLTPDGRRLFLQEDQDYTLSQVEIASGSVRKLLDSANNALMSEDGRLLYVIRPDRVAAYAASDLLAGKTTPVWGVEGRFARMALGGNELLVAAWGRTGALVILDSATGKELARGDARETADAVAAGPGDGWAIVVAGERPSLIRYDAALKVQGETPITYAGNVTYDAPRSRYLVGGQRYGEGEPRGHPVILSIGAADGRLIAEHRWAGQTAPTCFASSRSVALVAFAEGGPSELVVLDPEGFAPQARIPTGARVEDLVVDDASQTLYVADDLGRIHVLRLPAGEETAMWEGLAPLALDAKNGRLYANRLAGVVALDARTGALLAEFGQPGYPAPDPEANLVYIADNGVTLYDRAGKRLGTLPSTFPTPRGFTPNPYAYRAQVNPVTGHVAVVMHNGIPGSNGGSFIRIYPRQSDVAVTPTAPHSFIMDVTAGRQGNWYVAYSTARAQEAVQVLSPDGRELRRLDRRTGYLALDESKDALYLFIYGRVTRLVASTLAPTDVFEGPEAPDVLAFSSTNQAAYLAGGNSPLITPQPLRDLGRLDLRPVPARPAPDLTNDSLAVAADGRERLLAGHWGDAYRSGDGNTWERLLPGAALNWSYLTAADLHTVFVTGVGPAGGEGAWRSIDGGDTWEWLVAGLTDLAASGPVLANGPDQAYLLNRRQGLLRWNPGERKWEVVSTPSREGQWGPITLAPDGALFRSNEGYLERSTDSGSTWARLGETTKTGDVIGFSSLYTVTQTLFSVVRSGYQITGLQRSGDGGKTWQASNTGPLDFDGYQPEIVTGFGRTYLFVKPYNGQPSLLRTTDYGATWQAAPAGTVNGADHIAVDPLDGRLWLGVKGGVRAVDPEKLSWTKPAAPRASALPSRVPPTPAPTATAGPCRQPLMGNDAAVNAQGLGLGCPKGPAESIQMARQRFQNGQMIWRGDRRQIYVLQTGGRWQAYVDTWTEGEPPDDPNLVAPTGLQQPVRGFGKVWRLQLGGPQAPLGWALEKEAGLLAQAQDWDHGTVLRFGGEVIVLFDRGEWK